MKRLVELPCDIGDPIYEIIITRDKYVYFCTYEVKDVSIKSIQYAELWEDRSELGKTLFLNKEEAKKKFMELRQSDDFANYKFVDEDGNEVSDTSDNSRDKNRHIG